MKKCVSACITASCRRTGGIVAAAALRLGGLPAAHGCRASGISSAACSLVCGTSTRPYLHVTPVEVQWITTDTPIDYNIESNTQWTVQ